MAISNADLLARARWQASKFAPYLSRGLWAMTFIESNEVPTAGIDERWRVYINPKYIQKCVSEDTLVGELLHELMHPTMRNKTRGQTINAEHRRWNACCFPAGTMLPNGRRIEDVATMHRYFEGDLIEVRSQTGVVQATPEHPFLVRRRARRKDVNCKTPLRPIQLHPAEWCEAQNIEPGDYVLVPRLTESRDDTVIDLRPYIQEGTDGKGRHTFGNRAVKEIPLTVDTAWLIGLYVAEGSKGQLTLGTHESDLIQKSIRIINELGWSAKSYIHSTRPTGTRVTINSSVFQRWLHDNCGRGSKNKHIPAVILHHSDDKIRKAFLEGYVAGDGSCHIRDGRPWITIGTVSLGLASDIVLLLSQLGFGAAYNLQVKGPRQIGDVWTDSIERLHRITWCPAGKAVRTGTLGGKNVTTEYGRWKTDHQGVWTPVRSVNRVPFEGEVYNLTTPSGTYVANGVLVHNCDAELDQQIEVMVNLKGERVKLVSDRITPDKLGGKPGMVAEELYRISKEKHPDRKVIVCHCSGGSGVTGEKESWELPDPSGSPGEGKDGKGSGKSPGKGPDVPQGLSEAESQLVLAAMAHDVMKHAEKRGRGSVPAGVLRWAEEFGTPPPIAWELLVPAKLRYALDSRRGASPSYARPSRRSAPGGLVLPVHRLAIPRVTIVGDTSGSMGDQDIGKIIAVVYDACESLGKVSVVSCAAAAHEPVEIRHVEDLREHLFGGGGTDMVEGIRVAAEATPPPDVIMVVTDGDTPWPEVEPEIPVIVVLTRNSRWNTPPTWAEVIVAGDEGDRE